jgi:triphosphoribosyl-dephospho-CoA synthase
MGLSLNYGGHFWQERRTAGLADQRGAGAHHDLSLELMRRSANVLKPYFATMAFVSGGRNVDTGLREELAAIGQAAERAMFRATSGTNTHKGAIRTLGLLVAAAARVERQNADEIAAMAGAIARLPLRALPASITHGNVARTRYGAAGARGEAWNGFPHVVQYGLPMLRERQAAGRSEVLSRLDALIAIMERLDDTCVLYRGGIEALAVVKSGAKAVLAAGGYGQASGRRRLYQLDRELIAAHISPGGSPRDAPGTYDHRAHAAESSRRQLDASRSSYAGANIAFRATRASQYVRWETILVRMPARFGHPRELASRAQSR